MGAILLFLFIKNTKLLIIKDILDEIIVFRICKADINIDIVFIIIFKSFFICKRDYMPK